LDKREAVKMTNRRRRQRRERWARFRRACSHLFSHALKWAVLSYGFLAVYGALYGSEPAMVHRLGMTLATLSGGFAGLFISLVVLTKVAVEVSGWLHRHRRSVGYG
jgi:polyferredoxin